MNVLPEQKELVKTYFYIRIWAAPASLGIYVLNGWLFGLQNAWYPLLVTIVVNVVNIVLSYALVEYYNMGVAGVAWGTVVAQYTGLILLIGLIFYKYRYYFHSVKLSVILAIEPLKQFLNINGDIFIRTVFLTFALGFFYSQSSKMGPLTLAANLILFQFINWMSYGIDGFAFAAESLVGKYKGAKFEQKLKLRLQKEKV